jgi:hypothetical protein
MAVKSAVRAMVPPKLRKRLPLWRCAPWQPGTPSISQRSCTRVPE